MFGLNRKKEPWQTAMCKGLKIDGHAAKALVVRELNLPDIIKLADASELCTKIGFGRIYQKPGTLLSEHDSEDQGFTARFDNLTKTIGLGLRQGLMRQTIIFATREPELLAQAIGLTLDSGNTATEPTVE